ncbi:hypothetical protein Egran_02425 [Elaphomyces granulatus]|uniref:Protein PBN1 n=1 Tax=Elaphomyces granulatus TaxID=519963 RepID=A0A232M0C6_9EURO|nr:hypothetical protein Egran_02425 [Elaphomyces granulatus]
MKRRVTFVFDGDSPFEPDQAQVTNDSLLIRDLHAAKEDRATFSFTELPIELWQVLKQSHELHIRWAAELPYNATTPFSSRVSPGLHILFTPLAPGRLTQPLCQLLIKVFSDDLKCLAPEISFTIIPVLSQRFASNSSLQFYSLLPSLNGLVTYIQQKICRANTACLEHAASILSADSVDIDYDSISHSLIISGYFSKSPGNRGWTEKIRQREFGWDKVEVGLLELERATNPEELSMGGLLTVVGEDDKLKPTLFSFPSRHHPLPPNSVYRTAFTSPTGLHPTLKISIPRSSLSRPPAPHATCALHTYLTLPSSIFVDKYQLSTTDPLFLNSHNIAALRGISGATDLEAPDWLIPEWGSNILLELATPQHSVSGQEDWNITIPLHLRYLKPSESGYRVTSMPWPIVFWACTAEDGTKMSVNPFSRGNLGWDGNFGPRTMFFQLHPSDTGWDGTLVVRQVEELVVPVLPIREGGNQARNIELGTIAVIFVGCVWVLWKLSLILVPLTSGGRGSFAKQEQKNE